MNKLKPDGKINWMTTDNYDEITKNMFEHIRKARQVAFRENIKANTIVIDKEIAKINGFYYWTEEARCLTDVPTSILGLKVKYAENLSDELGIDTNFAILEVKEEKTKTPLSDYSTSELLLEIEKRIGDN